MTAGGGSAREARTFHSTSVAQEAFVVLGARQEHAMNPGVGAGMTITGCLREMSEPLANAAGIAKAALACAERGWEQQGVSIAMTSTRSCTRPRRCTPRWFS